MPRGRRRTGTSQAELVSYALAGIDAQIQELQQKRAQLAGKAAGTTGATARGRATRDTASVKAKSAQPAKARRKVSASTRRKLKEAAKRRWAREKGDKKES